MAERFRGMGLRARFLVLMAAVMAAPVSAQDTARGKLLYENHCSVCHESQVHIREARKAKSTDDIREFVLRWRNVLELDWSAADVDDVTEYLNRTYYHHAPGS